MSWHRPVGMSKVRVRWQNNREPRIADDRLATFGHTVPPARAVAPELFTARVMARIESRPMPVGAIPEHSLREGLVVVAATLAFSAAIVLASVGVLALVEPTTALMLLGAIVSGLVSMFSAGGNIAVWMSSTTANEVMLASLATLASVSVLIRLGIGRHSVQHAPREA
jgi:hypothetical protein